MPCSSTRGPLTLFTRSLGRAVTRVVVGLRRIAGVPSARMTKEMFHPSGWAGPCRVTPSLTPTPIGAPVSLMSKKSPFTPPTPPSARTMALTFCRLGTTSPPT